MTESGRPVDREAIHEELERVRADFHRLVSLASPSDLRRRTDGTRWTNQQMLFHMVFGYLIVRRLLPLVRGFGRVPEGVSQSFARMLDAITRPFHLVNYLGSCGGALVFRGPRLTRLLDHTLDALHRRLDAESEAALCRGMHFPVDWDPFFRDTMTLAEVFHYGTRHYEFHRRQLTVPAAR